MDSTKISSLTFFFSDEKTQFKENKSLFYQFLSSQKKSAVTLYIDQPQEPDL